MYEVSFSVGENHKEVLSRLNVEDLKVGDSVVYCLGDLTYGSSRTFLCNYYATCKVVRITPKRTKVELESSSFASGTRSVDLRREVLYKETPRIPELRKRASMVKNIADKLYVFIIGDMPPSERRTNIIRGIRSYVLSKSNEELMEMRKDLSVFVGYIDKLTQFVEESYLDKSKVT